MPFYRRRRFGLKRKPGKVRRARYYKRRAGRMARAGGKHGGMFIVRKLPQFVTQNTLGAAGSYAIPAGQTSTCLTLGTITASPAGNNIYDVPFALQFRMGDLVSSTELQNVFDKYKITSAKVKVQTTLNTAQQNTVPIPFIDYVADKDDWTPLSTSDFREKMGVKTKYFSGSRPSITMGVKPVPAAEIYNSLTFTGYAVPGKAPFINMAYPDVPHYGIKGVIRNLYLPANLGEATLTWDVSLGVALRDVQ